MTARLKRGIIENERRDQTMQLTLKAWRVNANLSIGETALKMGKTSRTIYNWESGQCMPDISNLSKLAEIYHTSINHIFLGDKLALSEYYKSNQTLNHQDSA